jgi:hypothetical protein
MVERRIFMEPTMGEASGNPILHNLGGYLVRGPAGVAGKSKPNPQAIQEQAEEENDENLFFL